MQLKIQAAGEFQAPLMPDFENKSKMAVFQKKVGNLLYNSIETVIYTCNLLSLKETFGHRERKVGVQNSKLGVKENSVNAD